MNYKATNIDTDKILNALKEPDCEECPLKCAFAKLAAYEDTGLTPEEIEQLRRERDAAVKDIQWLSIQADDDTLYCEMCDQEHCDVCGKIDDNKDYPLMWEWHGVTDND